MINEDNVDPGNWMAQRLHLWSVMKISKIKFQPYCFSSGVTEVGWSFGTYHCIICVQTENPGASGQQDQTNLRSSDWINSITSHLIQISEQLIYRLDLRLQIFEMMPQADDFTKMWAFRRPGMCMFWLMPRCSSDGPDALGSGLAWPPAVWLVEM